MGTYCDTCGSKCCDSDLRQLKCCLDCICGGCVYTMQQISLLSQVMQRRITREIDANGKLSDDAIKQIAERKCTCPQCDSVIELENFEYCEEEEDEGEAEKEEEAEEQEK